MKLLFVVGNLSKKNDANINIVKILSSELIKNGYEIFILGTCDSSERVLNKVPDEICYRYFRGPSINDNLILNISSKFMVILYSLTKNYLPRLFNYVNTKLIQKLTIDNYKKNIELLSESASIDVVISVSSPIVTSISLAKSDIDCKKIMYQLDPHYSHYINRNPKRKLKALIDEARIYKSVNCVVTTDLIYDDNRRNILRCYYNKMHQLKFPNIRKIQEEPQLKSIIDFNKRKINCVFIGNLYHDIRNPRYLLEVFQKIQNDNIVIHFIGGGDTELLHEFKAVLNERILIHGIVDNSDAIDAMIKADILINIGNTISNQLPSKIFDYISTGKPIINFIKYKCCPTLKYTTKYPLVLNVNEEDSITESLIKNIEEFCIKNKGRKIDYSMVKIIYNNWTVEKVSQNFIYIIDKIFS